MNSCIQHSDRQSALEHFLGCPLDDIPDQVLSGIDSLDLNVRMLDEEAVRGHVLHVLQRLHETRVYRNEEENREAFERGWSENLALCMKRGVCEPNLIPRYVRPHGVVRWPGGLASPADPFIVHKLLQLSVRTTFHRHVGRCSTALEFGCGSGQFLHLLGREAPHMHFVGLDWTQASVLLVEQMASSGLPVRGQVFDMTRPDPEFRIPDGSMVYTVGALEQIGSRHEAFLEYLIQQRPSVVIHHEPVLEFYDPDNLIDYLAILWHRRRDYLSGFWPALQFAARQRRIEILESRRTGFGDPYHESGSVVVWRPV